jgi:Cu-Zn family superoxide dismutase
MISKSKLAGILLMSVAALVWAAGTSAQPGHDHPQGHEHNHDKPAKHSGAAAGDKPTKKCAMKLCSTIRDAVCVVHPTEGNQAKGTVRFSATDDAVKIVIDIQGLTPGADHAIHIHEFGDCTAADGTSAGGHYNPQNHPHGLLDAPQRHAGDLGNIHADDTGRAHAELTVKNITIAGCMNPVLGRGMIVHAQKDDGGQPTGNAGGRIGCGVIGVAKSAK